MCITFFYIDPNPSSELPFKLILAFNRDELTERPTDELAYWKDDPNILAGRDAVAYGTWLGVNIKTGNIAILTNIRLGLLRRLFRRSRGTFSRGRLTSTFLKSDFFKKRKNPNQKDIVEPLDEVIEQYMNEIFEARREFDPFNLILGNLKTMTFRYMNNQNDNNAPLLLNKGIHGMSNSALDSEWPKVTWGKKLFGKILDDTTYTKVDQDELIGKLEKIMGNTTKFSFFDFMESSIFIPEKTKTTSIIIFDKKNELTFKETRHMNRVSLLRPEKESSKFRAKIEFQEFQNTLSLKQRIISVFYSTLLSQLNRMNFFNLNL